MTRLQRSPLIVHVPLDRAFVWFREGLQGFIRQPLAWALLGGLSFLILLLLSLFIVPLPVIGPLAAPVALQLLLGGMLVAAQAQAERQRVRTHHLWAGAQAHAGHLALVALFFCFPLVLMSLIMFLAFSGGLLAGIFGSLVGSPLAQLVEGFKALLSAIAAGWLISMSVVVIMLMALIFAPALIMFRHIPPLEAMRLSLRAATTNLGAILASTALIGLLFLLTLLSAGLGVVVFIPVCAIALRAAYRDIFTSIQE